MPILSAADQPIYFPSVTLTGAALDVAIASTQNLIESYLNRPLEIRQYRETCNLNMGFCRLSYLPIWKMPAPTLEGRFKGGLNRNLRRVPATDWVPLRSTDYELERSGRVQLKEGAGAGLTSWVPGFTINEIRATYRSGVDFDADSAEVRRLKSAAAAALTYSLSDIFSGIVERSVDKEYSVRYGSVSGAGLLPGTVPDSYFAPFRCYKPGYYQPVLDDEDDPPMPGNSAEIDVNCLEGQPVYVKNDGHLGLAQANTIATTHAIGLTLTAATAATSVQFDDGVLELANWMAAVGSITLTTGAVYFLSSTAEGMITTIPPLAVGEFVVRIGTALSPTRLAIEIEPPIAL